MSASSVGVLPLALGLAAFALCDAANQEYTPPTLNETYASNSQFIAHGLAPLYDFVGLFLRGIQQKDPLPADLLVVNNGTIALNENIDYGSVAQFYVGILAVLCVGLAVVLLAPCIGIIWCCSRCCGSSKHRGQRLYDDDDHVSDRKKQSGGPVLAPLVLSVITCLIVAGVAISFAANAYIENGVGGLGKHITSGTADMRLYIDNAETEVNTILGVNYNDLSTALNNVLAGARTQTTGIVNDFKTSLPLDEIDDMATGIKKILGDLKNIDSNITYCYQTSQSIVAALKEVKQDLKNSCGASCPEEFNNFTSSLKPPDFNQLPSDDIEKAISALDTLPTDFDQKLKQGREDVNKIGYEVENVMDKVSKSMNDKIIETGQTLQQRASELLHAATNASETLLQVDQEVSNYQDQYNAYYAKYRINGFAAYNAVILIIAALITLGLVYGSCCLKHSYSFLNIPVFLILLTISTWMLIVMTLFITGVATDRACEFLRRPGDHQLTHLVDALLQKYRGEVANSSQLPPLHSIKYYIEECRNDKTMYEVIDLDSTIHIENILKYVNNFDFAPFLETIDDKMTEVVNVTLLSPGIQRIIEDLKNSDLAQLSWETVKNESDSFQKEAEPLNKLIAEWQEKLGELGKTYKINVSRPVTTLGETLKTAQALQTSIEQLVSLLNESSSDVKLGHKSFPDALQWLLNKAADTQALVAELAPRVTKLANDTADGFRQEFRAYLQWVVDRVKSDAFKCKPIINIYDSMVVGVCDDIISPWNAYWALSGLCLLLFIPSAFVASSLASYKF